VTNIANKRFSNGDEKEHERRRPADDVGGEQPGRLDRARRITPQQCNQ
jgi:hypothetical protein